MITLSFIIIKINPIIWNKHILTLNPRYEFGSDFRTIYLVVNVTIRFSFFHYIECDLGTLNKTRNRTTTFGSKREQGCECAELRRDRK